MESSSTLSGDEYSRLLFDEATDGLFIANPAGKFVAVNRSGHQLFGYDNGELSGKPVSILVADHEVPRLETALAAVIEDRVQTGVWTMRCKDGKIIHGEARTQRLSNGLLLAVIRELGARDEYALRVQRSEARLWSILYTAPDTILTVDRGGKILFINRTQQSRTLDQVVGASCYDFVPAESRERVAQAIEHVFTTRLIDEYEVLGPADADGNRHWHSVRVGPLINDDQVIAVTMCATDVTAYKREVTRTQELLAQLHKIASLVPGMVFQLRQRADGSSCFPYVSGFIRRLFNLSPESVQDDASAVFSRIHPEDIDSVNTMLRESAAMLRPIHHQFRVTGDTGEVRWLSVDTALPLRETDGSTLWHGFLTDITERREAEALRLRLEEQLMQSHKMDSLGQLAGGVAHDFNNLLTVIAGFVDLSLEELPDNTAVRSYLQGIRNAASRGTSLTQQLVAFARKKIVRPEHVNLNTIVNDMVPMIRRLVGEHINVELQFANDLQTVKVDLGSIEQVLMNLVVNARDAMPQGGRLKLSTRMTHHDSSSAVLHPELRNGDYVVLSVSDTGCGMNASVRARLFEPFFTTKPKGSGTGLGLAMCHGIVTQAGGAIDVNTVLNAGTTFDIYLPGQSAASTDPHRSDVATHDSTGCETVLLVEDEPMILKLISNTLRKLGYHIFTANDGMEALEVAATAAQHIDLLVTDVIMPRLGGRELALRMQQQYPGLKVLFMSGYAENALAHQGELPEGLNFIQKPYQPAELAKRVREVLDSQ
ncbi:MAG: PAS domain S-box protein [Steroidobacter sp.]